MRSLRHNLRILRVLIAKDLRLEWRSREMLTAMLVFALLMIFIFNFALALDADARADVSAGVLWTTLAFAGSLGLNRSLGQEKDQGCLDGLLLAPVDRTLIFLAKMIINMMSMLLTAAIIFPLYSIFYNVDLYIPRLFGVVFLGTLGYSALGTLLAAMAIQARTRDILLPILLFPLLLPMLVAAVKFTAGILAGALIADLRGWIDLLVVYDLVFLGLGLITFEWLIEE